MQLQTARTVKDCIMDESANRTRAIDCLSGLLKRKSNAATRHLGLTDSISNTKYICLVQNYSIYIYNGNDGLNTQVN